MSDQVKKTGQEFPTKDIDLMIELILIVTKRKEENNFLHVSNLFKFHDEFELDKMIDKSRAFGVSEK